MILLSAYGLRRQQQLQWAQALTPMPQGSPMHPSLIARGHLTLSWMYGLIDVGGRTMRMPCTADRMLEPGLTGHGQGKGHVALASDGDTLQWEAL